MNSNSPLNQLALRIAVTSGRQGTFFAAVLVVLTWAATGSIFN